MSDVICVRVRLQPNKLAQVREWAREMTRRRGEAIKTLMAENVAIESVFLDSTPDGDYLIYYMRAASIEKAKDVAARSTASIQQVHQAFKRDTWADVKELDLLLDLDAGAT